jgi:hypothetical protein
MSADWTGASAAQGAKMVDPLIPASEQEKVKAAARAWLRTGGADPRQDAAFRHMNSAMSFYVLGDIAAASQAADQAVETLSPQSLGYALDYDGPQASETIANSAQAIGHALLSALAMDAPGIGVKLAQLTRKSWEGFGEGAYDGMPLLGRELLLIQIAAGNADGVLETLDEHQPEWESDRQIAPDDPDLIALRALCRRDTVGFKAGLAGILRENTQQLERIQVRGEPLPCQIIPPQALLFTLAAALLRVALALDLSIDPDQALPPSHLELWRFGM